jgi:hypothetical protein
MHDLVHPAIVCPSRNVEERRFTVTSKGLEFGGLQAPDGLLPFHRWTCEIVSSHSVQVKIHLHRNLRRHRLPVQSSRPEAPAIHGLDCLLV